MVLGFRTQWGKPPRPTLFEDKILDKRKKHTLREDLKNRWKAGNSIQFVVGNRTRFRRQFHSGECTGTQIVHMTLRHIGRRTYIKIQFGDEKIYYIGDEYLECKKSKSFVLNDGFDSSEEFVSWFAPLIDSSPGKLLVLKLIHWTDLRY